MIDFLVDRFIQLLGYLFQIQILKYLEKWLCPIFSQRRKTTLNVLHKSDNFIIVNKPFDVLINSDDTNVKPTVQTLLKEAYPKLANQDLAHEFYFAHRLDYSTSGVLCIALNKTSCAAATSAFEKRTANKYYLALVRGHLQEECIDVNEAIGEDIRHKEGSHKMCSVSDKENCESPRSACTRILLLARGLYNGDKASKILIKPCTGRRHQIRVHCSLIGHPIVGDYTYSNKEDNEPYRMFLHSYRLMLPNSIEDLDILTLDPFTETYLQNKWTPEEEINKLDEFAFEKINDVLNTKLFSHETALNEKLNDVVV